MLEFMKLVLVWKGIKHVRDKAKLHPLALAIV